jgi:hypothetical protein
MYFNIPSDKMFDFFEELRLRKQTVSSDDPWFNGAMHCIKALNLTFDFEAYVRGVEVREKLYDRLNDEADHQVLSVTDPQFVDLFEITGTPSQ